jgi:UDP-N-acetylglucosamine 2-epimerase (non-hydrolysing)
MLIFLVGTTAELIKIVPVYRRARASGCRVQIWSAGQQPQDLKKSVIEFGVDIDHWIGDRANAQNLSKRIQVLPWVASISWAVLRNTEMIREIGDHTVPNAVVVHGDTMTALWGVWLAKQLKFDLIHIEAGLRSGSIRHPFPEELCRRLISRAADINYAPDSRAVANLNGKPGVTVCTRGNTVKDSLLELGVSEADDFEEKGAFGLVSLHRSELLGSKLQFRNSIRELISISRTTKLIMVVDSLTKEALRESGLEGQMESSGIASIRKLPYFDFVKLLFEASFVITDSGGLQEECAVLGKPCLVHRRHTERVDGLGFNASLSEWQEGSMIRFVEQYDSFKSTQSGTGASPSDVIATDLRARGYFGSEQDA